MIPPKYKFYAGPVFRFELIIGVTIDDVGNFTAESGKFASGLNPLDSKNPFILFDLSFTSDYNAIFFYDESEKFISSIILQQVEKSIISVPSNAKYWGIRFTQEDTNFMLKRNTSFMYNLSLINPCFKNLSKKYTKENRQEFFRASLDGKISLFGPDYEKINTSSIEENFIFIVYKYSANSYVEYYKGEFSKTDCTFNHDKKKCEPKIITVDSYNNILNKYDNTYDLIKLAPEISKIDLHKRSLMQVYVRGANSITNFFGGTYWEGDIDNAVDSHEDLVQKYHFAYIKAGNEFYVKNASISEVNGVYAGTNGFWTQQNGYTCYAGTSTTWTDAYIYIKRDRDNTVLYKSEKQWAFLEENNFYIGRDDIVMVNVNDVSDKFTIESPFVYHIYCRLLCDVDTVEDSGETKTTYDVPLDDFVVDNRNYKKCIGFKGGNFFCSSVAINTPTKYGLNDYGQYFTNRVVPSSTGLGRALPISRNSWANASLWYVYDDNYEAFEKKLRKKYTLKNSYSIGAAIKALLKKIDSSIMHEPTPEYSQFLYGDINPLGLAKFYVYIAQKTNILKGDYDQPAQKAEISLEELMKMLRDCFRCYWYIEDNKFKIEHIRFFMNGGSYSNQANYVFDFTKAIDHFNKKQLSYFQTEISFDKSNLPSRYEFNWMDESTDLFGNVAIDVKSSYVQKDKTEEITINQFSSDVDYMLFNPSSFSNNGFALLCPVKNEALYELPIVEVQLIDENKVSYKAIIQNWYASWIYLQNFYMYDMPGKSIESNVSQSLTVSGVKKCMKHTITFLSEDDLSGAEIVNTKIGQGQINEMSFDITTRQAKINLLYPPY